MQSKDIQMSIADNIKKISARIPEGVLYIVVSKYRPQEQLREAYDAGARVFAESRPAELAAKAAVLPSDIQWHFIGHLQTNKLKLVLPYCSLIHSADSEHLMEEMEKWCAANGRDVNILMEVHIAREQSKQGFSITDAEAFFAAHRDGAYPHLHILGLMGMASNTDDTERIHGDFASIQALQQRIRTLRPDLAGFKELSIGMSSDYPIALEHGATMVRIGTASFEPQL